jgi:5-methylcytosine-specific restriction protein A
MAMVWGERSATERGYGWEWQKVRRRILERDRHICQCPDCKGGEIRVTPATHVDHIVSKAEWKRRHGNLDGVDAESNLRAINKDCHERKSTLEKGHQPRYGCDINGFPLDPNHPWSRR